MELEQAALVATNAAATTVHNTTPVHHITAKPVQSVAAVSQAKRTTPTSSVVNRHVPTPVAAKPRVTLPTTTQQIVIRNQLAKLTPQQQRQFFAQQRKLRQQLFPKTELTASKSKFLRKSPKKNETLSCDFVLFTFLKRIENKQLVKLTHFINSVVYIYIYMLKVFTLCLK